MTISVVIPCFNVQKYIEESVLSVISQEVSVLEIICVDNSSTDATLQILEDLAGKFPLVKVLNEYKPGANAARNRGLSIASGEWIQFLDADDLLLPGKLANQIKLISADIDFIAGSYFNEKLDLVNRSQGILDEDADEAVFINHYGNTCSNLWRRKALIDIGGWNENLRSSQETDLMFRLILSGAKSKIDPVPLTIIRVRPSGQISQGPEAENLLRYIDVRLRFLDELKYVAPDRYFRKRALYYDFLLNSILRLGCVDRRLARDYFRKYLNGKRPTSYRFGMTRSKQISIKILGIRGFLLMRDFLHKAKKKAM